MTPDGIINIYKEKNMTSHDVVGHGRRIVGVKRVGHTGTLDPMATGVLPVCVGRSARVIEYLDTGLKKYRCTMKLGRATETYDVWGDVTAEASTEEVNSVTACQVEEAFSGFRGRITQLPPLYSAVKVNGKRLYEYARKGRNVDIPPREVYITSLEIEDMGLNLGLDSWIRFSCECTKGTFIRSICNDAGEKLGVHGALSELERTETCGFDETTAVTLSELREMDDITKVMHAPDEVMQMFGSVVMEPKDALRLINGLELERSVYRILEKPLYSCNDFYFPVREEYKRMYRVYSEIPDDMEIPGRPDGVQWYEDICHGREKSVKFIGLALRNDEDGHLFPEKIFI